MNDMVYILRRRPMASLTVWHVHMFHNNNSDYLQKARKYGHFTGYKN